MFVRVETGFKAGFSDPEANRIQRKISEIHPVLSEKIRWMRKLNVVWMDLEAPRDRVVNAIYHVFKNPVTEWIFTGDLLPSAAGASGTLLDLMQVSPFRPGVFHGIEKRKRLQTHDENALVVQDALQTVLGRRSDQDRVVTGELLMIEGVKLVQSDLEWIARNWFSHDQEESWSLLSEEELKHNSRFQSEQVAKYLVSPRANSRSRLLQFRAQTRGYSDQIDYSKVEEVFRRKSGIATTSAPLIEGDDWSFVSDIRFSSGKLHVNAQTETEFNLIRHQLDSFVQGADTRLQTVLAVLPEKSRLWRSENQDSHPIRIREDFENSLRKVAETTDSSIALMKFYEESQESEPSYFWTSGIAVENLKYRPNEAREKGSLVDLIYIGHHESAALRDVVFYERFKAAQVQAIRGKSIDFSLQASGKTLIEVLKAAPQSLQYGFDLVLDGIENWFKKYSESPLPLGVVWGVNYEQREWLISELKVRGIPYLHFGTTSLTGDVRIIVNGEMKLNMRAMDFFKSKGAVSQPTMEESLLDEPLFIQEKRIQPARFRNRYSVEELVLKPETYHVSVAAPLVLRPQLQHWSGLMVLSDLCGQEFNTTYLDYLLRKCTAMGGQIQSLQVSFLNGLKAWAKDLSHFDHQYGIKVTTTEVCVVPEVQAHWLALQVVAKVSDVRTVRTEEFKFVNDRIYWLPGDFDHPATRWLAGFEGRYQSGLHGAVAIEPTENGVVETLVYALLKRRLGAEVRIQHHFPGGFFVSASENERFAVEEEWRSLGIEFEFVGRVTASPYLVIRNELDETETISIEDII